MKNLFAGRFALFTLGAALSVAAHAQIGYGLTDENDLVSFNLSDPTNLLTGGAITGLGGQDLVGIDFRPADGKLYGVGNFGGIFTINTQTFAATMVSTLNVPLSGSRFGIDFNPVPDRLRIISDTDQNLRVNVATGAATVDTTITAPGNENLTGVAYTNSDNDISTGTTVYAINPNGTGGLADLLTSAAPNGGVYTSVGSLGVSLTALSGFDIFFSGSTNTGYGIFQSKSEGYSGLYSVNLLTGAATFRGAVGGGDLYDGFAIAPVPEPASMAALAVGAVALLRRRRKV